MRAACFVCRAYEGDPHDAAAHRDWDQRSRRNSAIAGLRAVMDEQKDWPSNRALREGLYEAIALLSDES